MVRKRFYKGADTAQKVCFAAFLFLGEQSDVWPAQRGAIIMGGNRPTRTPEMVGNHIPGDLKNPSPHF
jgi:hypothetical protein